MSRPAFSLFELLLVLGLLAILAAIALPALHSWQVRIEIDRASGALVELVSEAKSRAVREGTSWCVQAIRSPASLTLKPHVHASNEYPHIKTDPRDIRALPNSIQIEFAKMRSDEKLDALVVNSMGKTTPARVWINQNGLRVQAYVIDRLTGAIRRVE